MKRGIVCVCACVCVVCVCSWRRERESSVSAEKTKEGVRKGPFCDRSSTAGAEQKHSPGESAPPQHLRSLIKRQRGKEERGKREEEEEKDRYFFLSLSVSPSLFFYASEAQLLLRNRTARRWASTCLSAAGLLLAGVLALVSALSLSLSL